MLPRILKNGDSGLVVPFSVQNIGDSVGAAKGVSTFVIQDFEACRFDVGLDYPELDRTMGGEDTLQDAEAEAEAARIIAQAGEQSEIIKQAASDNAEHSSEVSFETAVDEKVAEIRNRLADTIAQVAALSVQVKAEAEIGVVELALHIAKKIVGRDVLLDREIALNLVKVSLGKLHNRSVAKVHLNAEDFAFIEKHRETLDFRGTLELVEDRSISIGGCLITTETGDIDARIESQFDEIAHGLFD